MSRSFPFLAALTAAFLLAAIVFAWVSTRGTSASFQFEFTVNSSGDGWDASPDGVCDDGTGACTLRAAIEEANPADGPSLVRFNIPGAGAHTIAPLSAELPLLLNNVTVDGYTQPGAVKNDGQSGEGTNAVLMIEVSGANLGGAANGITMIGTNSTVKGLAINGFGGSGVLLAGASEMNVVRRSLIGTKADGVSPLGNTSHGIPMMGGADCNTIGGTAPAYRNVIAYNGGDGVALATDGGINNYVDPNFIHDNEGLGVDINDDGPTTNDDLDADAGPNDLQNYPLLTSAIAQGGGIRITGMISSTPGPGTYFNLFFLVNDECDPSGYGEGQEFIDEATIISDDDGINPFTYFFSRPVEPGMFVVASASNPESTSEFSQCVEVAEGPVATPTPTRPPADLIQGDVRCDGAVDATDALGILRKVAGLASISQGEGCPQLGAIFRGWAFGDVRCDGEIDAADALGVLRAVARLAPIAAALGCPEVGETIPGARSTGGSVAVTMDDNFFEFDGVHNPTFLVPAGETVTMNLTNQGVAIHNMRTSGADGRYGTQDDHLSEPGVIFGGNDGVIEMVFDRPGTYAYLCDFHPADMRGAIVVQ